MEFLRLLAAIRNPVLDQIMVIISMIGTPFSFFAIIGWFYLNVDKDEAYGMGLSFCFSCLLCQAVKVVVRMPRPWNLDTTFEPVEKAVGSATGYSFPSIHSQSVASLGASYFHYNKKNRIGRIISVVLIVLVAFSRMYLGVHTPLDVAAGVGAGLVITAIVWYFWNKVRKERRHADMFAFFLIAFAAMLIFLTAALLYNGTIDYTNASDSFKTAGVALGFSIALIVEPRWIKFSTEGSLLKKLLRFAIGLGAVLLVTFLMKKLPGAESIPMLVIRYTVMLLMIFVLAPIIFVKTGLMKKAETPYRTPEI